MITSLQLITVYNRGDHSYPLLRSSYNSALSQTIHVGNKHQLKYNSEVTKKASIWFCYGLTKNAITFSSKW